MIGEKLIMNFQKNVHKIRKTRHSPSPFWRMPSFSYAILLADI